MGAILSDQTQTLRFNGRARAEVPAGQITPPWLDARLNAIPTTDRAIARVASHPSQYSQPSTCNSPMTFFLRTNSIISAITGGASTPLMTALQ
jgi:hypothetical protein